MSALLSSGIGRRSPLFGGFSSAAISSVGISSHSLSHSNHPLSFSLFRFYSRAIDHSASAVHHITAMLLMATCLSLSLTASSRLSLKLNGLREWLLSVSLTRKTLYAAEFDVEVPLLLKVSRLADNQSGSQLIKPLGDLRE